MPTGSLILALVTLLLRAANCQNYVALRPTPCTNWEETKAQFDAATSVWTDPACYDFSYTFLGFSVGLPQAQAVQVRNGAVASGEGDKTIQDFFEMIDSLCISTCPTDGAHRCSITYASEGYPTSILIDVNEYMADEERVYELSDFEIQDCSSGVIQVEGEQLNQVASRCGSYEEMRAGMEQAEAQWSSPACYDFTYERMTSEPVDVQVRNGVAMDNEKSISDYLRMIKTECLEKCLQNEGPMEYECTVAYAEEQGYPIRIDMMPFDGMNAEEDRLRISNFSMVDCGAVKTDDPPSSSGDEAEMEKSAAAESTRLSCHIYLLAFVIALSIATL